MKPVNFKEQNCLFEDPGSIPMPAHHDFNNGRVVSCWKGNLKERLLFLFIGRFYLTVTTGSHPIQPMHLTMNKWETFNKESFKK